MKQEKKSDKKIITSLIFVLFLYIAFGIVIMNDQKNNKKSYREVLGAIISTDCTDAGGVVGIDDVTGKEYCQFLGSTCPDRWTQTEEWASQTGVCATGGDICGNHKTTCPTEWANPPGDCTARAGSGGVSLIACTCGCRPNQWHNPGGSMGGNHRVFRSIATSLISYGSCGIDAIGCTRLPDVCGDGIISGDEECDTNGNIGCADPDKPFCNGRCSFCVCSESKLVFLDKPIVCTIQDLILFLLSIIGGIALLMIVLGGIFYIFAGANPEAQGKAKKTFNYAIIGLIFVLISYAIIGVITDLSI